MDNKELKKTIRNLAVENDISGVMELTDNCDLSYARVSKVWQGSLNAKFGDVCHVAKELGYKIEFTKESNKIKTRKR